MLIFVSLIGFLVVVFFIGLIGVLFESLLVVGGDGCFGEGIGFLFFWEIKDSISYSRGWERSIFYYYEVICKGEV